MLDGKTFQPIDKNLLVKMDQQPTKVGLIHVPDSAVRHDNWGTVVAKGDKVVNVQDGDLVLVPKTFGTRIEVAGVSYILISEHYITCIKNRKE